MLKRCIYGAITSAFCGLIVLALIEIIVRGISGEDFVPLTPEYIEMFPSLSMAIEADILLYGIIGFIFSAMSFIYEKDRIGFVVQNMIYFVGTGVVWIPIVVFMWQLQKYPQALLCTILGFAITYVVMTVVGYKTTKKDVNKINEALGPLSH